MKRYIIGFLLLPALLGGCPAKLEPGVEPPPESAEVTEAFRGEQDEAPGKPGPTESSAAEQDNQSGAGEPAPYVREPEPLPEIDLERITNQAVVDGWVYFLYPHPDPMYSEVGAHQLYRWREDGTELERISERRCDSYDVVGSDVYFADYSMSGEMHGILYAIQPGEAPQELADELCFYQIVGGHIYYALSLDTIGVGMEAHALHRIDLDGAGHIIAAYEVIIPGAYNWHIGEIRDGYIYYNSIRVRLGDPADGTERVEVIAPIELPEDGWLYYSTNRLLKARPDGSGQIVLDGDETTWMSINRMEGEWIYYTDNYKWGSEYYKIKRDGSGKTSIGREEYYGMES